MKTQTTDKPIAVASRFKPGQKVHIYYAGSPNEAYVGQGVFFKRLTDRNGSAWANTHFAEPHCLVHIPPNHALCCFPEGAIFPKELYTPMKTQTTDKPIAVASRLPSFEDYKAAVARFSPRLANSMQSELMSMFRLGISPMGAAVHLYCIHNR